MLPLPMLELLEKAMNRYITLDPCAKEKLQPLVGKALGISVEGLSFTVYIFFHADDIFMSRYCQGEPDLMISGPPFALLALLQSDHPQAQLHQSQINITGDVMLAQKVKYFFKSLDIPWEYYLSFLTGDVVANQSATFIKNSFNRLKSLSKEWQHHVGEYVQEEAKLTPHHHELALFCEDVDGLRTRIDLLEARFLAWKKEQV